MTNYIKQERVMPPPPVGYYRCCACGNLTPIREGIPYEGQSDCEFPDCFGQHFCNKWEGWDSSLPNHNWCVGCSPDTCPGCAI